MHSMQSQGNAARAGIGLVLISALAWLAPVHAGEAVVVAAQDAVAPQDYYARRAAEILKQEDLDAPAPHPLAASYPHHSIVVCEAGCGSERRAEVVFMEPREALPAAGQPGIVKAPGASAAAKEPTTIDCVGGCYDTPRRYQAAQASGRTLPRADAPARSREKREPFDPRY